MNLPEGLYDMLLTQSVLDGLSSLPKEVVSTVADLGEEEVAERLSEAFASQLSRLLDELGDNDTPRSRHQLELVNALLVHIRERHRKEAELLDAFAAPPQVLRSLRRGAAAPEIPETGLAVPWLFTAGKGSPSLLVELRRELSNCDQADIVVSFITIAGVRKLFDILQSATALGASGQSRVRIRILTTTYTGATEQEALDYLARLPSCETKVSLDGRRSRLHAKAWIFHRRTGFGSAYVGSANLSGAALLGGLEWTVKFTEQGQRALFARAKAHFETLWNDGEFQPYDPQNAEHRSQLARALKREAGEGIPATTTFFDLEPKGYQKDMLEQLELERERGRFRNLVVAATGTGKTVVAAFDYRAACQKLGGRPRLLFVAHRLEILRQARRTFQEVLRDHSFGELLAEGRTPEKHDHLFATIESVTSRGLVSAFGKDFWHTIVVDECHRLAASQFNDFVTSVKPTILLGLTATPERSDGKPIFPYFDNRPDGSPAVELRLWQALDLQVLCPFEYYGCDDETDFSEVPWDQPGERDTLDNLLTGNDVRARLVLNEWRRLARNPRHSKALVFCVTVAHAEFMTRKFNEAGLPAICVVGKTDDDVRRQAPERLARGEVSALATCDLYNEGVDLPSVDTLLLLRPTQSPVLFQQQIGRGLRLYQAKESCLVLDFVGRYRTGFRFDRLLSSITGLSRKELISAVETGFGSLPPGCHIQLQQQTREQVLRNLRAVISQTWRRLQAELQSYVALRGRAKIRLADFLRDQALDLDEIYRDQAPSGWTALKRAAGLITGPEPVEEAYFGRRFSDVLHCEDPEHLALLQKVGDPGLRYDSLSIVERLRLQMLTYQVDGQNHQLGSGEGFLKRLAQSPDIRSELAELGEVLRDKGTVRFRPLPGLENAPLLLHARYGIREILTAVGYLTSERRRFFREGSLTLVDRKLELLFVTLDKSAGFHDRIAYRDYAISAERFHWETQNSAGPETTAGRRYLESETNGWSFQLFVRTRKGEAYRACGPVTLETAEGAKPMSIVWKLRVPLPPRMFQEFSVLRGT